MVSFYTMNNSLDTKTVGNHLHKMLDLKKKKDNPLKCNACVLLVTLLIMSDDVKLKKLQIYLFDKYFLSFFYDILFSNR